MNALDFLNRQHQHLRNLFARVERAEPNHRAEAFESLARALRQHSHAEQHCFYPVLRGTELEATAERAIDQLQRIQELATNLLSVDAGDDDFSAGIRVLRQHVEAHLADEEEQLFPLVRERLSPPALLLMGELMQLDSADDTGGEDSIGTAWV